MCLTIFFKKRSISNKSTSELFLNFKKHLNLIFLIVVFKGYFLVKPVLENFENYLKKFRYNIPQIPSFNDTQKILMNHEGCTKNDIRGGRKWHIPINY
jgi:hypothetical protein